ncbi:ZIP family metal transporter [Longibacter salinarum]|uniref:ZIP family metal transporter n=1 Tax=Longibacter salinarum TaxID=1850348 RepID=A0A2A8D3A9_9BACT|nr:ZIP family metal transporter [Longibacter salinarum]PEN15283.1 ZIP family metal transporter [Longibacter salinarum]
MDATVWTVLLYASITAVATGLGALPLYFLRDVPTRWVGLGNAAAAGLMLAASFNLIFEGVSYGMPRTMLGVVTGLIGIVVSRRFFPEKETSHVGELAGAGALKAILIVGIMTVHSFAEGIGVGVSFGQTSEFGAFISLAIAVHNIPEGVAISLVLVPRGEPIWRAGLWSIFSSLPQPLMAVPAFLFVAWFRPVLPVGLGIAAGAMIWMVFSELVPEALEEASPNYIAVTVTLAIAAMMAFQVFIG